MGATYFDRDRGTRSGRIVPSLVTPADGAHVFVLGAEGLEELAQVSPEDYTEVKQILDLTGVDLVGATFDTIGTLMGQFQPLAGFDFADPDLVFGFDFNVGGVQAANKVAGGFALDDDGDIESAKETYSGNDTYCRRVPEGAGVARLLGDNVPQAFPALMPQWTLQWWMDFRTDLYPSSTGVHPEVLRAMTALVGGLRVMLVGAVGLHEWAFNVEQHAAGLFAANMIGGFVIDPPQGWRLYTIRFDQALPPPNQLELFVDDALAGACGGAFTFVPAQPASPEVVQYGSAPLVGGIDDIRLLSRWLSDLEIAQALAGCTTNPTPSDYKWVMQILVDGRLYGERRIDISERRTWKDFFVPVRLLTGPHEVAFRLKLEAA